MKHPEMKELLTEWRKLLNEEEERAVFNTEKVDLPIPKKLVKLLDPDITPQKFAQRDAELDAGGNEKHQAFAIAAFAMTYADNDTDNAAKLIKLSLPILNKIKAAMGTESENPEENTEK